MFLNFITSHIEVFCYLADNYLPSSFSRFYYNFLFILDIFVYPHEIIFLYFLDIVDFLNTDDMLLYILYALQDVCINTYYALDYMYVTHRIVAVLTGLWNLYIWIITAEEELLYWFSDGVDVLYFTLERIVDISYVIIPNFYNNFISFFDGSLLKLLLLFFIKLYTIIKILVLNIVLMLIITLVIAALTLIERKFLALTQRRVGPYYVGYRGRLQYIADALKLFLKGITMVEENSKYWFYAVPSVCCVICYFFWINSVWAPSLSIFEIEYNLVYMSLLSALFGFCIILLGYFSGNKYSRLAAIRSAVLMLNLELFLGLMVLSLTFISESFCLSVFVLYQENFWLVFLYFIMCGIICLTFMMEVARTPFDLAEAESELVTGYSTEIGGFMFGIFYLGEYFHLFFFFFCNFYFIFWWLRVT